MVCTSNHNDRRQHPNGEEYECSFQSLVAQPRAFWIECASAESDGWLRRPVRGAPPSATTLVSEWVKLPAP
jgi:hypothetical protein